MLLPEPRPLGDPVDSDPTPPCDTYPKAWEHRKEVQVTPDTVTTLTFVTEEPTVWSVRSIATLTRTLTVSQDTNNGSEVEAVVTFNRGGLGPVTHSFPPSHQGGRGTTIERRPLPGQQPTKEVYLTPLCMNNSGTNRSPNSVSPHSGVHPTRLTIPKRTHIEGWDSPPSHQGVDGAVACRPRSTG